MQYRKFFFMQARSQKSAMGGGGVARVWGSAVAMGGQGACPPNNCLCPPFRFTQNTFWGITQRQNNRQ